ncbi:tetratricopeptide repeat protein [Thalassobius sp. I31.1]|uniref:tetratricopeptide repeat protein n=1 Tax=Thalassobius sp. I31.1 TaxID=2109912 RepID=UPI000D1BB111|nr:tetratricopeptide repeat protein [Thalassobius sp. I31.1]
MFRTLIAALFASTVILPTASYSEGLAGAYLAARQASFYSDYAQAADWYSRALIQDPQNPVLQENALTAWVGLADFEQAIAISQVMRGAGFDTQQTSILTVADLGAQQEFETLLETYQGAVNIGPLVDGLVTSWALVGAGQMSAALEGFDAVSEEELTRAFGLYHKALALAQVGDYEGADGILSGRYSGAIPATVNGILTHVEVLSQLERNADALELLQSIFGHSTDPVITQMTATLEAGDTLPLSVATSASEGLAEVFFSVAGVLESEAAPAYALLFSRTAEHLNPRSVPAMLLSASLLEKLEQYDLANTTYDRVPRSHPSFHEAEIGRAEALRQSGKDDAAIEALRQLAETRFDLPVAHSALGDALRSMERFEEASAAYDNAIALFGDPEPGHWGAYYTRGITLERQDRWEEAEADFRFALELSPGQPFVLNYLGYSLVEKRENLDEALAMIEQAVEARPDDGYITDSLGWVLYRLGRYDEAVGHMERAAELEPVDPVVSDHLGDVLWAVGRQREAVFQWKRALSFVNPDEVNPEADPDRIRRKLDVGLDVVLEEEGADPLAVAGSDD